MDKHICSLKIFVLSSAPSKNGCESQDVELGVAPAEASCNVRHTAYTRGIDIQQISVTCMFSQYFLYIY
jgi:hypothetical protein